MADDANNRLDVAATLDASDASIAPLARTRAISGAPGTDFAQLRPVDPANYAVAEELARGGMGRILRARDLRLGRSVAIKELLPGHDDARFEREARITARLQHPSIVHVHEAGRWPSGEPFFAMKLVAGKPLDRHLVNERDLPARLALVPNVIAVVDALAYAHSEHVIHRDLKPANILCGDFGETVVIDWGLAKDLTSTDTEELAVGPYRSTPARDGETVAGAVMGTPAYMPPEQAEGQPVDARADVYALGAILYHVLAGAPPYEARNTEEVLARVLTAPPRPLATRVPDAPVELVAIVDKAMAREAADRFPTAKEMADELKRFQTGQLVTSHRYTAGELMRRWLRKHRGAVAVGVIAVAVLAIVGIASVRAIVSESHRADHAASLAVARADQATLQLAQAALETDPSEALVKLSKLSPGAREWGAARTIAADAMSRGVAQVIRGARKEVTYLAFSRDGALLAAVEPLRIRVWDLATLEARDVDIGATTMGIGFTPAGELVHVRSDGAIFRWSPLTRLDRPMREAAGEEGDFATAHVSPNGRWVVLVAHDAVIIELETGALRQLGHYARVAWAPDNTLVVHDRSNAGSFFRIDPVTLAARQIAEGGAALGLAATATQAFAGTYRGELVDLVTHQPRVNGHKGPITAIAALPDGTVATASSYKEFYADHKEFDEWVADRTITISDPTRSTVTTLRGHGAEITTLAVAPDGRLASADVNGEIRLWQRTPVVATPPDKHTTTGAVKVDAHTVAIARLGPAFDIRDVETGATRRIGVTAYPFGFEVPEQRVESHRTSMAGGRRFMEIIEGPSDEIVEIFAARDGRHWVTLDEHHHAIAWDVDRGGRLLADKIELAAISGDGSHVVTYSSDRELVVWDAKTGMGKPYELPEEPVALALSRDGAKLALAGIGRHLYVLEREHVAPVSEVKERFFTAMAFSADDTKLVCGERRDIVIVDLVHRKLETFTGHDSEITSVELTPDGNRVISTSTDSTVRVWDVHSGNAKVLRGHTQRVRQVDLDGNVAVTSAADGVRLWDVAQEIGRPLPDHDDPVVFAMRLRDGRIIAFDHHDRVSTYTDLLPHDELGLRVAISAATNIERPSR